MTPEQAADLAARTLAAITESSGGVYEGIDRERVASDLAGLRHHDADCWKCDDYDPATDQPCPDAVRYAEGLRRTAGLYGVTP